MARLLSRQARAALGAAAAQNIASTYGCHAGAKAVTALADKLGWLVSALHDYNSVYLTGFAKLLKTIIVFSSLWSQNRSLLAGFQRLMGEDRGIVNVHGDFSSTRHLNPSHERVTPPVQALRIVSCLKHGQPVGSQ